jgi:hypothetical protein
MQATFPVLALGMRGCLQIAGAFSRLVCERPSIAHREPGGSYRYNALDFVAS